MGVPELILIMIVIASLTLIVKKKWLAVTRIFFFFTAIIMAAAIADLIADPSHQPIKNISAILIFGTTLVGIWLRNKKLTYIYPLFGVFQLGLVASETKNIYFAIGQLGGAVSGLFFWFFVMKNLDSLKKSNEPIPKIES